MNKNNFETVLPKRATYEKALEKDGYLFHEDLFSYLDQSKWEDRFLMLIRIARNSTLETDPRMSFHKYVKSIEEGISSEIESIEDLNSIVTTSKVVANFIKLADLPPSKQFSDKNRNIAVSCLKNWQKGQSNYINIMLKVHDYYQIVWPSYLVKRTSIGELVYSIVENLEKEKSLYTQVISFCNQLVDSLILFVEQLQEKTITHIINSEELFLHKEDTDWGRIAKMRLHIDDVEWFFRNFCDCCTLSDWYSTPYSDEAPYLQADFTLDYVLHRICTLYTVDLSEYVSEVRDVYLNWVTHNPKTQEEIDQAFDHIDHSSETAQFSDNFHYWKEKHPLLSS